MVLGSARETVDTILDFFLQANRLRSTFSRISAELKDTVTAKLLQGLEPAEIVRQNVDCFISSHMVERGIMDRDEGRVSLEASQPPRDYFLSYADVANFKDKVDKQQWKFSENTQQSLRIFVEQNSSDILLYSEQEPIKGTADYDRMMQGRTVGSQTAGAGKGSEHKDGQAACPFYTDLGIEPAEDGQGSAELEWGGTQVDLNQPPAINHDRTGQAKHREICRRQLYLQRCQLDTISVGYHEEVQCRERRPLRAREASDHGCHLWDKQGEDAPHHPVGCG